MTSLALWFIVPAKMLSEGAMKAPWGFALIALLVGGCAEQGGTGGVYTPGPFAYDAMADKSAAERHAQTTAKVAESGKTISWTSLKGASGTVSSLGEHYKDPLGRTCRQVKQQVTLKSTTHSREAEACRLEDGTWVVMGNDG